MSNAEAWFNNSLRPRKPEGSVGRAAQDGHLDSHTALDLWGYGQKVECFIVTEFNNSESGMTARVLKQDPNT